MIDLNTKFKFYQDIQLWPKAHDFNYKGWLDNFSKEERPLAEKILDFFVYFPDDIIHQLFRTVVGRAGYYFKEFDSTWCEQSFSDNCWYSYVPGETNNPSDSGSAYLDKVKYILGVPEERLMRFGRLLQFLDEAKTPQNVILTDDFVGSGAQCFNAWNLQMYDDFPKTLKQIVAERGHRVIYVPLIVNFRGKNKIEDHCEGLRLEYAYELGPEWSLLLPDCLCWDGDSGLYNEGKALIVEKSKELGIPDDNSENSIWGFMKQGLALGFPRSIPDACPTFFRIKKNGWIPLKERH